VGIVPFQRRAHPDAPASEFAATVSLPAPEFAASEQPVGAADDVTDIVVGEPGDSTPAAGTTQSHIGRYALKRKLGEGGLGTVYEAWDPLLSRTVAVKTLQFDVDTPSRVSLDRLFLNEARLAAALNHPNIVTIYDAGLSAQGVYIAMERLKGRDLREALRDGWRPTPVEAARLVRRVADGLAYAHARGVVHCDIKPANIFIGKHDKPKILDFGIARVVHGPNAAGIAALDGLVAGSPHYLAPEQLQDGPIDERTDVYALGVVLYELLTGRKAFDGDSLDKITRAVLEDDPPPASSLRAGVPQVLSAITARAMAREPAQRHANAAALAQDLRRWLDTQADGDATADAEPVRPRRIAWPWAAAAAVAAVAVAAWMLAAPGARDAPPVASSAAIAPAPTAAVTAEPPAEPPAAPLPAPDTAPAAVPKPAPPAQRPARTDTRAEPKGDAATRTRAPTPSRDAPAAAAPAAAAASGVVQLAISPWGEVEVDGRSVGTAPPLTRLTLPEGRHTITVRNADFEPQTFTVDVQADKPVQVKHRFGL
jgi:serine/threonine-protein kinase